ncbi:MAG: hypothetical protein MJ088_04265 [Clostridia bacterium]|nr:hypothetical protein [Clostridia bacterium]
MSGYGIYAMDSVTPNGGPLHGNAGRYGVMLLICGASVPAEEARSLRDRLSAIYRRTEIITEEGGQPLEDYFILLQ